MGRSFGVVNPESARAVTQAALDEKRRCLKRGGRNTRAFGPYGPRHLMAGDPASPGGTKVTCDELADDVLDKISAGGGGSSLIVREEDGVPTVDPVSTLVVPNDSLTAGPGAGEATIDFTSFELREVILAFAETVAPGTAINIQTGVYAGALSPATIKGDSNVTLPLTGVLFADDGRIEVHLNGQELDKGDGSGNGAAEWVSSTQIKLSLKLKNGSMLMVRAPFPTA